MIRSANQEERKGGKQDDDYAVGSPILYSPATNLLVHALKGSLIELQVSAVYEVRSPIPAIFVFVSLQTSSNQ